MSMWILILGLIGIIEGLIILYVCYCRGYDLRYIQDLEKQINYWRDQYHNLFISREGK